jgi:hypothetical protein
MRKFLVVILLFAACISSCKKKQADVLADIKKKYAKINDELNDLTLKEVDDLTSAGSGKISGYYQDKEVKKIYWEHFTDTNRTFSEYYFDDGMLIFAIDQDFVYNRPMSYTEEKAKEQNDSVWYDDKKTELQVNMFYFNKNKLIKWIAPGSHDMPVNTAAFTDKESELWAKASLMLKHLRDE